MPVAAKQNRTLEILLTAKDLTKRPLQQVKQQMLRTLSIIKSGFGLATRAAAGFVRQLLSMRNVIIAGIGAAMTKFAADFEDGLAQVAGLIDDPRFDLAPFSAGIRDIAIETGDSFASLNKSLFDTISAGVDAAGALDVLRQSARLAAAGGTDTATAVNGVTNILNAYGLAAGEATRITDALFQAQKKGKTTIAELSGSIGQVAPLASTLGVSLEEVTAALSALTTVGLSTDEAATQLKGFFTALVKPGAEAKAAASELGIEFNSAALEGGRFLEFLRELDVRTGGSTEALARLFPNVRALQGVLGLAKNDGATFNDVLDAMANKAGSVNTAFAKTNRTLGAQIRRTWRSIQSSIIDVIEGLRPQIEGLLADVRGFFTKLAQSREQLVGFFRSIGTLLGRLKDAIVETFRNGDAIQSFVNLLAAGMKTIAVVVAEATPFFASALKLLGRSAAVAFVRQFFGSTKEELVRNARGSFFGRYVAKLALGGGQQVDFLDKQLELLDRIRAVRRDREELIREHNLLDEEGLLDLERVHARRQALFLKIHAETSKLARLETPDQDYYMDRTQNAIRRTKAQIAELEEERTRLKILLMDPEQVARRESHYLELFAGDAVGERALQADQEQLLARARGMFEVVPKIREMWATTLSAGISEGTRSAYDQLGAAAEGVGGAFAQLAEAMGRTGKKAGQSLVKGLASGASAVGKVMGKAAQSVQEAAAQLEKIRIPGFLDGAVDAVRRYIGEVRDAYNEAGQLVTSVVVSMEQSLANAFVAIANRTKDVSEAFEDMAKSILASVQQLLSQALARQLLSGLFAGFTSGASAEGVGSIPDVTAPRDLTGGGFFLQGNLGGGDSIDIGGGKQGSGSQVVHIEHHYHISAIDGRSVQRFFEDNQELIAAQNLEVLRNSPGYRQEIRRAAR